MEEYNINLKEYPYNLVCAVYQGRLPNVDKNGNPWMGNPPPHDLIPTVNYMLESLDEKSQTVLRMRFQQDMAYGTIGEKLGLSIETVRRIITKSLYDLWKKDKNNLLLHGIEEYTDRIAVKAVLQRDYSTEKLHAFDIKHVQPLSLNELNLPIRAYNCLTRSGFHDAEEVAEAIKSDPQRMAKTRNLGRTSYQDIIDGLVKAGLLTPEQALPWSAIARLKGY